MLDRIGWRRTGIPPAVLAVLASIDRFARVLAEDRDRRRGIAPERGSR